MTLTSAVVLQMEIRPLVPVTTVFQLKYIGLKCSLSCEDELIILCKKKFSVVFFVVRDAHIFIFSLIVN